MSTPARRYRPLPPIPVSAQLAASAESHGPPYSGLTPPRAQYDRRRGSAISIASVNSLLTILPAYSADPDPITNIDLNHQEIFSAAHPPGSSAPLFNDPPPYSPLLPHGSDAEDSITPGGTVAHEQQDPLSHANPRPQQRRSNFVQHRLFLAKKGAPKPWATLSLVSRPPLPNSLGKIPRFIGGDSVKGALELELESPTSIHSLTLNVGPRYYVSCFRTLTRARSRGDLSPIIQNN